MRRALRGPNAVTGLRGPNAVVGLGLVLLYVVVAVVTQRLQPDGFRPLFDGFAPPLPYKWVNPPRELAGGNQLPTAGENDVPLGEGGSQVSNTTTPDAQAIAQLEAGSVPPNPPDTAVRLTVAPVDPGTLAALPPDVKAVSNAYRVSLAYQPSQTTLTQLVKPGTIALTASTAGDRLLYSADGRAWQEHPSRPYGNTNGRFASLPAAGYYLVAGHSAAATGSGEAGDGGPSRPNPFLLFLVGVVPIVGAVLVLRPPPPLPAPASRRPTTQRRPTRKRRKKSRP